MPVHDLRPLVARGAELEALASAVGDACDGRPAVVVVRGEAGIGKSRLVREVCERPPDDELVVLRGDCFRVDAGELPFAPLAAALRDAGEEELEQALAAISPGAQRQLGTMFPHLFTVEEPAQRVDSDRHAERQQFDALLCLLGALAALRPRLLVIEDLHWADRSTRDFVGFLARSLRDERLATVITYRTHLPPEEDRAAQTIADLASRGAFVDVDRAAGRGRRRARAQRDRPRRATARGPQHLPARGREPVLRRGAARRAPRRPRRRGARRDRDGGAPARRPRARGRPARPALRRGLPASRVVVAPARGLCADTGRAEPCTS